MTDTARPAQTGRYRSVSPSGAYVMEGTGDALYTFGQSPKNFLSKLFPPKSSTHVPTEVRSHGLGQPAETGAFRRHFYWQFRALAWQRAAKRNDPVDAQEIEGRPACQMIRTKGPPNSTRSRHMRTGQSLPTTGKKITRRDTSTRSRLWNMQIRRWSGHRRLIGSPREPRGRHDPA
jgi:hypothetical protein